MINIKSARADTPACENLIHFNNAGASLMPDPVFNEITAHLELERKLGGYEAENLASEQLAGFYSEFAALLSCMPEEIAYVENATRAWDMAFYGLPLERGDRILTHRSEYASNFLALLQQSKRRGLEIDLVPSDSSGQIDIAALESMIGARTRLIALTHVPTQGGLINPAEAVGKIARKHQLIYMLDACQSVGQINLDVHKLGCHILSGTGRKFLRGPRGTGFLYVAAGMIDQIEPPFIDLHSASWTGNNSYRLAADAKRFENWESYVAGRIGLARAVRYARDLGLENIEQRVIGLAATMRDALSEIPKVKVQDQGIKKCAIVSFEKEGVSAASLAANLLQSGINVSVSGLQSAPLDFIGRGLNDLVRASVHYFNTENEIDRFIEVIKH